jgi:hypothetical protein
MLQIEYKRSNSNSTYVQYVTLVALIAKFSAIKKQRGRREEIDTG